MYNKFFYIVAAAAFLAGCSADDLTDWKERPGGPGINFGASAQTSDYVSRGGTAYSSQSIILKSDISDDSLAVYVESNPGFIAAGTVSRGAPTTDVDFSAFSVSAFYYRDAAADVPSLFFEEEVTRQAGGAWSTGTIYYWPTTEGSQLAFLGVSPSDIASNSSYGVTLDAGSESGYSLTYTAPDEAEHQPDLMVAVAPKQNGHNQTGYKVPMQFSHILSQVSFVVGSEMQDGTINSITLDGIAASGTYSGADGEWTLVEGDVRSYTIDINKPMSTDTPSDDGINTVEQTLMMLPQTLSADSRLTVSFTKADGETVTLVASLAGSAWEKGGSTVYRINIKPDFTLEFASAPEVQDAHYVIYPIKINADKVPEGGWTLTSNEPDYVTFVENFTEDGIKQLVDQGYWLEDNCGERTLTSTTSGTGIDVYVFLKENISDNDRDIVLSLSPANDPESVSATFSFKQYCPSWNNGIGVERLQEKDCPWGFLWDNESTIVYDATSASLINRIILAIYIGLINDDDFVSQSIGWFSHTVTIDFSELSQINNVADDLDDGVSNTTELYNYNGIGEASSIMEYLVSIGCTPNKELPQNPTEFSARMCALKNRFKTVSETQSGVTVYTATLVSMDWYLPAKAEAPYMMDSLYPLEGSYWTSTSVTDDNTKAYKYEVGVGSDGTELRSQLLHVRAVRKKVN